MIRTGRKPDMAKLGPSKNTRPELVVRGWLAEAGYRVLANHRGLPGSPDAVLPRARVAVFVDGRHWHDPATAARHQRPWHQTDWIAKARRNRMRDLRNNRDLRSLGYSVVRIWDDCTTTKRARMLARARLVRWVRRARARRGTTVRISRARASAS